MIVILPDPFDYHEAPGPLWGHGSGHSVSGEPPDVDPADEVRRVAEEIAGLDFSRPKARIGFY